LASEQISKAQEEMKLLYGKCLGDLKRLKTKTMATAIRKMK
jgi:hypothetical protein